MRPGALHIPAIFTTPYLYPHWRHSIWLHDQFFTFTPFSTADALGMNLSVATALFVQLRCTFANPLVACGLLDPIRHGF